MIGVLLVVYYTIYRIRLRITFIIDEYKYGILKFTI